jgi:two-component system, NtrC family, nitrogen regulation sensor histidine kinase NtrY
LILFKKYWRFLVGLIAIGLFALYYIKLTKPNYQNELKKFQLEFSKKEKQLKLSLDSICYFLDSNNLLFAKKHINQQGIDVHVFKDDSLILWNTNSYPISRFVEIQFPSNGLLKLQNGWYYSKAQKVNGYIVSCSFLLKHEYLVENEYLQSTIGTSFTFPFNAVIVLDKNIGYQILSEYNKYLFSIEVDKEIIISESDSLILLFLWLIFLYLMTIGALSLAKNFNLKKKIILIFLFIINYLILVYSLSSELSYLRFLDPTLYAFSIVIPNFFVLISHSLILAFLTIILKRIAFKIEKSNPWMLFILFFGYVFILTIFINISNSIVKDSSIPIEINKLFDLNLYSISSLITIGLIFYSFWGILKMLLFLLLKVKSNKIFLSLFILLQLLFLGYSIFILKLNIFIACYPCILSIILYYQSKISQNSSYQFTFLYVFIGSVYITQILNLAILEKERAERKLYAEQLATEQDISTELNFAELDSLISEHPFFEKVFDKSKKIRSKELKDFMDKTFYKGFWERYELDYLLYYPKVSKVITGMSSYDLSLNEIKTIILEHSKPSQINKNLFYIKDYISQLSYISKIKIFNKDSSDNLVLYSVYKSKRIPEKIGFPKLLVSQNANVIKVLENYTLAKYYNQSLVSQNGDFSYPLNYKTLLKKKNKQSGYYNYENYDHLVIRKKFNDVIVLSKKEYTFFQQITSFSYLCCFYSFFVLISIFIKKWNKWTIKEISFASKIQFTLIGIILLSLVAFGMGSGIFIKKQYDDYQTRLIKEKIQSIQSELQTKISEKNYLSMEQDGDFLSNVLTKLSKGFSTDICIFDPNGYLVATSRQKLFNLGLISEQINSNALKELKKLTKTYFFQNENIGKLNYLAVYAPIYNKNKLISYINLQYFDQKQGYVYQIEKFLVSIINIFILLLIFSIVIAIIVSNWLTNPLRILQKSLLKVQMGQYNEPIAYVSKDEIGELVKNYNLKLNELAMAANKLAQSEREYAWREMAKQVAHEIKNPLTPMKLSLQHLQRIYNPNDPITIEKLNKVIYSLIEQIDTLTKIANEFSNFAKMPKENLEKIDLVEIITNVVIIYQEENFINVKSSVSTATILGDKNLLLQVFNNLLTNAIQARDTSKRKPFINVVLVDKENSYIIMFEDNGVGIPDDQKERMFEPNFTTKSTGSGLGLALSKKIVEAHNGKIWFESNFMKSTKFFIELPKI